MADVQANDPINPIVAGGVIGGIAGMGTSGLAAYGTYANFKGIPDRVKQRIDDLNSQKANLYEKSGKNFDNYQQNVNQRANDFIRNNHTAYGVDDRTLDQKAQDLGYQLRSRRAGHKLRKIDRKLDKYSAPNYVSRLQNRHLWTKAHGWRGALALGIGATIAGGVLGIGVADNANPQNETINY